MYIAADSIFLHPYHQGNLAVGLKAHQAIYYMAPCLLKHLCPVDIVFFVKTGFQLHQNRHLLSIVRCLRQSRNNGRVSADTVQGLLDGQDRLVPCSAANKVHHRIKTLIWMVKQDIALPDIGEYIVFIHKGRHGLGHIPGCLEEFKAFQSIHLHEKRQVQRAVDFKNILAVYGQFPADDFKETLIHIVLDFQTDGLAPLAFLKLLLDFLQQVHRLLLIYGKVGISHDAEGMRSHNVIIEEQRGHVPLYDFLQQDNHPALLAVLIYFPGKLHNSGNHRGNLHHGKFQLLILSALFPQKRSDIQRLVPYQREGSG